MRATKQRKSIPKTLSFPKDVLEHAESRAAEEGRSLSNYFQKLAADDLARVAANGLKGNGHGKAVAA